MMLLLITALVVACAVLTALCVLQRRRVRELAGKAHQFLDNGAEPLDYTVSENSFAPLHNAVAELERSCLLAREQQAEECRRTSALISDISHQLKTPLSSLRLFCEMDEGEHMEKELQQIERMEKLIYSLLRLERLCADGYEFHFEQHDVAEIVKDAWREVDAVWPGRKLQLTGHAILRCDAHWLGEAFLNLMKNACEHMRPGAALTITLDTTPQAFFCTVEDEGGGVSEEDLPRLFERFYRAKGQEGKGSGLGLAIVREILFRHHGTIVAENTEKGLKFTINLPIMHLTRTEASESAQGPG